MWWVIICLWSIILRADSPDKDYDESLEHIHDLEMQNELVIKCHDSVVQIGETKQHHKILKLIRTKCRWQRLVPISEKKKK